MSAPRQVLQVCKVLHRPRPAGPLCLGRTFERGVVNVTISKNVTITNLMSMSDGAPPSAALELTLRGVHKLRIARDGGGIKIGVENLDTGDMFGRTVVPPPGRGPGGAGA